MPQLDFRIRLDRTNSAPVGIRRPLLESNLPGQQPEVS